MIEKNIVTQKRIVIPTLSLSSSFNDLINNNLNYTNYFFILETIEPLQFSSYDFKELSSFILLYVLLTWSE